MKNMLRTGGRAGTGFFLGKLQESRSFGRMTAISSGSSETGAAQESVAESEPSSHVSSGDGVERVGVAVRHHMAPNLEPMKQSLRGQLQLLRSQSAVNAPSGPVVYRPGGAKIGSLALFKGSKDAPA